MARQAMWVHGHSANIEMNNRRRAEGEDFPGLAWTAVVGLRMGEGVKYRCQDNSDYWFHFAIPTPTIKDDVQPRPSEAMVLFTTSVGVTLSSLHVWDGPNQVFTRNGLAIGGANTSLVDGKNKFKLDVNKAIWGIGISVLFHFADFGEVTLHSAGVNFDT